jgi:voltage-gated sodium channel
VKRLRDLVIAERVVIATIVLNTIALSVMAHLDSSKGFHFSEIFSKAPTAYAVAWSIDYACICYFLVEMLLKVNVLGWSTYWRSGWNRFDFVVVMLSIPVLLRPILDLPDTGVILTLRLGRLFRLFRMMRFIPNREHLYKGVKRALRASVGVFLALLLLNIILALGATQFFKELAPEYFGNPLLSSYSLFKVFTIEGWYEIPDAVAAAANAQGMPWAGVLARLYFVGSVTVGGLLGLALANAVFVDEMMVDNNDDLEKKVDVLTEEVRELRKFLEERKG